MAEADRPHPGIRNRIIRLTRKVLVPETNREPDVQEKRETVTWLRTGENDLRLLANPKQGKSTATQILWEYTGRAGFQSTNLRLREHFALLSDPAPVGVSGDGLHFASLVASGEVENIWRR